MFLRSCFQLSLRRLLGAFLLICLVASWLGAWISGLERENEIVTSWRVKRHAVEYVGPSRLQFLLGDLSYFRRATDITIDDDSVVADWCGIPVEFPYVRILTIRSRGFTDSESRILPKLRYLNELTLNGTELTNTTIAKLPSCVSLNEVYFESINIAPEDFDVLIRCRRLNSIGFLDCSVQCEYCIEKLFTLPQLRSLDLRESFVDEQVAEKLVDEHPNVSITY